MNLSLVTILKAGLAVAFSVWLCATLSCFYFFYNLGKTENGAAPVALAKDFGRFLNDKKASPLVQKVVGAAPTKGALQTVNPLSNLQSYLETREREEQVALARQAVGGDASDVVLALAVANLDASQVSVADISASQSAMVELRKNSREAREQIQRALHRLENYEAGAQIRHAFVEIDASLAAAAH